MVDDALRQIFQTLFLKVFLFDFSNFLLPCFQTIRDGNVLSVDVLVRTSTLTNENWHAYYRRL